MELEDNVREHANRLHQYVQDFCPSDMSSFPVPWDDSSNVIFT